VKLIERRVGLLFAVFTIASAVVMLRSAWLQAVKGGELSADAHSQQTATIAVPGMRGSILDRRGDGLAVSEEAATIFATPYQVEDPPRTARRLAERLDLPVEELLVKLTSSSGFEYLARQVDTVSAERVRKLELAGIGILPDSARVYPQGEIGGRLIGAVGTDGAGLFGIEAAQQETLGGSDGQLSVTRDALGEEIGRETVEGAERGSDVQLTIDAKIQSEAESALAGIGKDYQPEAATAIAMDPRDGEVLAMASWPPVDPTELSEADPELLGNMATGFTYEPGSTFKAFTVAGALEDGEVEPATSFDLPPTIQVADREIEESHPRGAETMDVAKILAVSSNVGAVTIGLQLNDGQYGKRFDRWVRRFGFSKPTGIDFPGEEAGIVPEPRSYSGSTMGNLPIGQGLAVTPLQMMAGYAAIANGGVLRSPRLVEAVDGRSLAVSAGKRILGRQTARQMREMLVGVLEPGGTASVSVPGYELAGKTGTSQKVVDGAYSESEFVASFVGFAPAKDPELLVAVVVDDPKGDYYGGTVAAPAFGEIARFALPYLGVKTG
jgi:cell division protein FtsI (penicillin-binding protein 3)